MTVVAFILIAVFVAFFQIIHLASCSGRMVWNRNRRGCQPDRERCQVNRGN